MASVVFIHGTGVRQTGHDQTLEEIRDGVKLAGIDVDKVLGCLWGERFGVRLDLLEHMLPSTGSKAIAGVEDRDTQEAALWFILLDDPLFELRIAGMLKKSVQVEFVVNQSTPHQLFQTRLEALLQVDLAETGLDKSVYQSSFESVLESPEAANAAIAAGSETDASLVAAIASAIVATCLTHQQFPPSVLEPEIARNPSVRAEFEARLREAIAPGGPKGVVGDWFRDRALELATALMKPRRAQIMDLSTRFFGDIFLNLRHGDDIRQMIRKTINQASPPVLVMAHSLGGDIMFDLLTRADPPKVAMLVTVGSQVPFFYAMDGLHSIQPDYDNGKPKGASTKQAFEFPWINVYNVNDLLSFRASGVFQWPNLTEFHLESKVPFPMSHGTYFSDSKFYQFVKTLWNPMVQS